MIFFRMKLAQRIKKNLVQKHEVEFFWNFCYFEKGSFCGKLFELLVIPYFRKN